MTAWADALARTGRDVAGRPGAGAAGGIGAALLACGATLVPGLRRGRATSPAWPRAVADADLVFTGEGSLDAQTAMGKAPAGVARLARSAGALVVGLGGRVERPAPEGVRRGLPHPRAAAALSRGTRPGGHDRELSATAAEVVRLLVAAQATTGAGLTP